MTPGGRPPPVRLTDSQRLDWLRLIRSEGVGPRTFRKLVNHFGSARTAVEALPDLARQRGLGAVRVTTLQEAEREMEACRQAGVRLVATGEADYPVPLGAIPDAPPLLLVRGRTDALLRPCVAIVGSRNASAGGMKLAATFARELATAGLVIVSGLARGIDAAAHEATVETGTVAVLAGGHDRIYPPEHGDLADRILEQGALVSEMPMGWEPRGRDFPRRNRLVSGLSIGIVLVEGARRSGSLITARFAADQGRDVYAVPGSPLDPRAEGPNALIRQGATMVLSAQDILEGLRPLLAADGPQDPFVTEDAAPEQDADPLWDEFEFLGEPRRPYVAGPPRLILPAHQDVQLPAMVTAQPGGETAGEHPPAEDRVDALIGAVPVSIDELARAASLPARQVAVALYDLERRGLIDRHAGGLVSRRGA